MNFLVTLDVLLGLSLIYLVFSLAVTSINESIAAALSSRARWLRKGIGSLLSSDPKELAVSRGSVKSSGQEGESNEIYADNVLDSPFLSYLGTRGIFKTFRASYVSAWTLMQGILSSVKGFKNENGAFADVSKIQELAQELPQGSPIRSILIDLCARANRDLDKFRELLEAWFKTFEDQLSAWYRQKTQYVLIGLSFFVVVTMNIDTIDIARQLSADPKVRAQLVEQAMKDAKATDLEALMGTEQRDQARKAYEEAVQNNRALAIVCQPACQPGSEDQKKLESATETERAKRAELAEQQKALDQRIKQRADNLSTSGLMVGWRDGQLDQLLTGKNVWEKLIGLILSAFAIALGAPFWFNMLKSIASVRSVGLNVDEQKASQTGK